MVRLGVAQRQSPHADVPERMKWRVPLYLILAAVFLYWFGKWQQASGQERGNAIAQAKQALASGKAYRKRIAKLTTVSRVHSDTARRQQAALIGAPLLIMTPLELRGQVAAWQAVARHWELAFRAESATAAYANGRIADLETSTSNLLTVADCHIAGLGFLPRCPSRTVSFVIGLGAGAVAVLATH